MVKRKPRIVGKQKSLKRVMEYEHIKEDKSRRKALSKNDAGSFLAHSFDTRSAGIVLVNALRSSYKGCKLVFRKVKENDIMLGVVIFLVSVWLSGWYSAKGKAFEALLSVVVGVLIPSVIMVMKGRQ